MRRRVVSFPSLCVLVVLALLSSAARSTEIAFERTADWDAGDFFTAGAVTLTSSSIDLLTGGDGSDDGRAVLRQGLKVERYGFVTEFDFTMTQGSCVLPGASSACAGLTFLLTDDGAERVVAGVSEDTLGSIYWDGTLNGFLETVVIEFDPYLQAGDNNVASPHVSVYATEPSRAFLASAPVPDLVGSHTVRIVYDLARLVIHLDGTQRLAVDWTPTLHLEQARVPLMPGFSAGQAAGSDASVSITRWSWKPNPSLAPATTSDPACPEGGSLVYYADFEKASDLDAWTTDPSAWRRQYTVPFDSSTKVLGFNDDLTRGNFYADLGNQPAGQYFFSIDMLVAGTYDGQDNSGSGADTLRTHLVTAVGNTVPSATVVQPICPTTTSDLGCFDDLCDPSAQPPITCASAVSFSTIASSVHSSGPDNVIYKASTNHFPVYSGPNITGSIPDVWWVHEAEVSFPGGDLVLWIELLNTQSTEPFGIDAMRVCRRPPATDSPSLPWPLIIGVGAGAVAVVGAAVFAGVRMRRSAAARPASDASQPSSSGKASSGKASIAKGNAGTLSVGKGSTGKLSVGKASAGKSSAGKGSVGAGAGTVVMAPPSLASTPASPRRNRSESAHLPRRKKSAGKSSRSGSTHKTGSSGKNSGGGGGRGRAEMPAEVRARLKEKRKKAKAVGKMFGQVDVAKGDGPTYAWKSVIWSMEAGELVTYVDEDMSMPAGLIDLSKVTACRAVASGIGDRMHAFRVHTASLVYNVSVEDDEEVSEWVGAINHMRS